MGNIWTWAKAHKVAAGIIAFVVLGVVGTIFNAVDPDTTVSGDPVASGKSSDAPSSSAPAETPSPTSTPTPVVDEAAEHRALEKQAEKAVVAELPNAPIWKGLIAKGHYISETEVCVDRTYGPTGGLDGKGGNAGYVIVTFPGAKTGEPKDGKCASAPTTSSSPSAPVTVPADFQDDPGLVTRNDLGAKWPLTVDFGAVACDVSHVDNRELDSVTLRTEDGNYALNGTARSQTSLPDIDPIWADDPSNPGAKLDIGPLIKRGLALC